MPLGEVETHPYLDWGETQFASRLILGSFPVYECTSPDNSVKKENREKEGTIRFFYGSKDSKLWSFYEKHIDFRLMEPRTFLTISKSIEAKRIALSDLVVSCERKGYSSSDTDLRKIKWNRERLNKMLTGRSRVTKILCTSKGVLDDLEDKIISPKRNPIGHRNEKATLDFQDEFISDIGGDINLIVNPVVRVFNIGEKQIIAVSIPSPGSPQRKIKTFGCDDAFFWKDYADNYFEKAFLWFKE